MKNLSTPSNLPLGAHKLHWAFLHITGIILTAALCGARSGLAFGGALGRFTTGWFLTVFLFRCSARRAGSTCRPWRSTRLGLASWSRVASWSGSTSVFFAILNQLYFTTTKFHAIQLLYSTLHITVGCKFYDPFISVTPVRIHVGYLSSFSHEVLQILKQVTLVSFKLICPLTRI